MQQQRVIEKNVNVEYIPLKFSSSEKKNNTF